MESPQFLLLASPGDKLIGLYNLSQVSSVIVVDGGVQLKMADGETVQVNGSGGGVLFKTLMKHCILPDGTSGADAVEMLESALAKATQQS